jgi:ATP-dependent DNA helicase RecG
MRYDAAALEALLSSTESDQVERKESLRGDAPGKAREAVCAFANDLAAHGTPGVLFIGAKDDGAPSGLAITDDLLRQAADMKSDGNIVPPPTLFVEKHVLRGAEFLVVTVEPADSPPVRYRGAIHVRYGPRRGIATAQDERILNEKRRHRDRPFDVQPLAGTRLSDLDRRMFEEEYLPAAFAASVLATNERSYEQRLAVTKMVVSADEPTPTVLGILVLGRSTRDVVPGAYVQFLRIAGRELADPIVDEQIIDGALVELLRRTDEKLASHNRTAIDIKSSSLEQRRSLYPMAALQQIVRNAIMHRTYEATHAPVRMTWYDDRIEIQSPGGPFGTVTQENFGQPGVADYRNPNLAEAMRVLGFVQRFGVGIATARRELEENGNPPIHFIVEPAHVAAIVRPAS